MKKKVILTVMPHTAKGQTVSRQGYLRDPTGQVMSCHCVVINIVLHYKLLIYGLKWEYTRSRWWGCFSPAKPSSKPGHNTKM